MARKVYIDPGHGGSDPGAVYEGRMEKDDVLQLALKVGELLENAGLDVEYTRVTDIYEMPFKKAQDANEANADFLYRFTAIPVRHQLNIREWRHWSLQIMAYKERWQEISMLS